MATAGLSINHMMHRQTGSTRAVNQSTVQNGPLAPNGLPLPPVPSNLPLRPNVQPDNGDANLMPFYDVLDTVMPPTSLQVTNLNQRAQEQQCIFCLNLQQVNQVASSRCRNESANRFEYAVQVQLRCLKIQAGAQSDVFPTGVSCRVNKQAAVLPPVIPTNKPNAEPQRPGRPINLTSLCRLSPNTPNLLTMGYNYDSSANYCVQITLVRALSPEDLIERIRARGVRKADFTRAMIRDKLSPSDSELAVTELVASLMCPLGKMRILIPMRAVGCSHVQCFDAYCYLAMNAKKPVWKCPFCDQVSPYSQLYIDEYFQEVLASRDSAGLDRLQFRADGSWCAANAAASGNGDTGGSPAGPSAKKSTVTNGGAADALANSNHVDLTLSDGEEAAVPANPRDAPANPREAPAHQEPGGQSQPQEPLIINLDSSDEEN